MTQENKELLIKDLCARLPYGVKIEVYESYIDKLTSMDVVNNQERLNFEYQIDDIKPYLFPMSSMTEEQEIEYDATFATLYNEDKSVDSVMAYKSFDWLNANHFDYRGLIDKGLAIDATNLNIY